ncbi:MAG TPA: lysine transporter LysE, partial [Candidatus Accumulibacter sp.]|nr:lysine transporter LysE [Accumulibacter sp.]
MVDGLLFLKAALIGLSIAAPVGPIGLLCIQRTLTHGARVGFVSGLGAAAADGVYGAVGAFGLAAVTQFFVTLALPLAICGAIFLAWMGVRLWRTPAPPP